MAAIGEGCVWALTGDEAEASVSRVDVGELEGDDREAIPHSPVLYDVKLMRVKAPATAHSQAQK